MAKSESPYADAYQLVHLLVGESERAAQALLEALRLHAHSDQFPWYELAQTALRFGADLSPDRFFLRSLAKPDGPTAQVDRLPPTERTALLLDASNAFTLDQIASLLRMERAGTQQLLARLWRELEAERGTVWSALSATVPPMERSLQRQIDAALAGDEPIQAAPAPKRAPRPRRPWLGLIAIPLVVALLALRWWPSQPEVDLAEEAGPTLVEPTPEPESDRLDLLAYKPLEVEAFIATGMNAPMRATSIAQMLFQWMREATFVEEAPTVTAVGAVRMLSLHFTDGRIIWLQPGQECWAGMEGCTVVVGARWKTPIRLQQPDLARWLMAGGWQKAFGPGGDPFLLYPEPDGARVQTEAKIRLLAEQEGAPNLAVTEISKQGILLLSQENGLWRTTSEPAWQVILRPSEPGKGEGLLLLFDDQTGAILDRRLTRFGPP